MPLVLAATPIGNLDDASARLRTLLETADVVAAEDTRRLRRLASGIGATITGRVVSYYDAVEQERTPGLLEELRAGRTVVLLSDAGTPLVADPGYRLVAAAAGEGLPVTVLPGPSAAVAALAVSGLPADRWVFEGFLPRRAGDRRARLTALAPDERTTVMFEAPHRLAATLEALAAAFGGNRPAVVCRELTKTYEEVRRGSLRELADWAASGVKGEVTLVVAGAEPVRAEVDPAALADAVQALVDTGASRRDAITAVADQQGISRRVVYTAATTL